MAQELISSLRWYAAPHRGATEEELCRAAETRAWNEEVVRQLNLVEPAGHIQWGFDNGQPIEFVCFGCARCGVQQRVPQGFHGQSANVQWCLDEAGRTDSVGDIEYSLRWSRGRSREQRYWLVSCGKEPPRFSWVKAEYVPGCTFYDLCGEYTGLYTSMFHAPVGSMVCMDCACTDEFVHVWSH